MKKKASYKDRKRKADEVRKKELVQMETYTPKQSASEAFRRPAYQSISVSQYLKKRSNASGQRNSD